ncbi:TonB family protein [Neolewinella xylanilytica]|uniref:TonB family protein n=1 Tax=Neolewinella xylanilytica TaxID=1514080 RepID=A0A2S6I2K4_9BACT|nr:energy transducer TonB [Neolewinella xylanilytica]PPK85414.1 TonB family protein [Neolewinella xylanilytica]
MQLFTFSGTTVLLGLVGLCLLCALGIYLLRWHLQRVTRPSQSAKSTHSAVFSLSPVIHRFALSASLFAVFLTLNWTDYGPATSFVPEVTVGEEISVDIPITYRKPTPPPPPPPTPVVEAVPDVEAPSVEQVDRSILEEEPVYFDLPVVTKPTKVTPPPPPMPPPPPEEENKPLIIAERMPVFGEQCKQLSGEERKACSDRELLRFVAEQIRYPRAARDNNIQGTVYVRFVVEKDGSVSSVEALRKVAGGCTEEALRAVEQINHKSAGFRPGFQGGRPVRVMFNMPIKFQLDN